MVARAGFKLFAACFVLSLCVIAPYTVSGRDVKSEHGDQLPPGIYPQPNNLLAVIPVDGDQWVTVEAPRQFALHVVAVAECESRFNPKAIGASGEVGLMQIYLDGATLPIVRQLGYSTADLFDPRVNLEVALVYWKKVGWRAWACAREMGIE